MSAFRGRLCLLAAQMIGLGALAGCSAPSADPDILLVTIDTLRPDALGFIGGHGNTPSIDALAAEGTAFTHGVTTVPITLPAHSAIMTGCYPFRFGMTDNGQTLAAGTTTLATRLRERGYQTAAFVSGFPLKRMFGIDQGFDHFDDEMPSGRQGFVERNAQGTIEAALAWVRASRSDGPAFVWVHLYDPHSPYEPPREFWQPGPRGNYDGEVAYVDAWLAELFSDWKKSRARERLTVVTSDHGEALGEHGEDTHGYFVYDSTVLSPIIWHWPGRIPARRDDTQVRHIDIAPTLAHLIGVDAPQPECEGSPLAGMLEGAPVQARAAHVETFLPWNYFGWSPLRALRDPPWKFIEAPKPELYRITEDSGEATNLIDAETAARDRMVVQIDALHAAPRLEAAGDVQHDVLEELRGLGYIGFGPASAEVPDGLADPKDRVELRRRLQAADTALSAGRIEAGLTALDAAIAAEPGGRFAALRAGTHLLMAGEPARAIPYLEQAVANDPERAEARFALGDALTREQRVSEALPQWLELARMQPGRFEAWYNIATSHAALGNFEQARAALDRASAIDPENPILDELRGRLATAPGHAGVTPP